MRHGTAWLLALVVLAACPHATHSPRNAAQAATDDHREAEHAAQGVDDDCEAERAAKAATDDGREAERAAARAYEAELIAAYRREIGTCDDESFDIRRIACRDFVPSYPVFWPNRHPIDFKCPDPPDAWNPACTPWMPCPVPPDRRVDACLRDKEHRWAPCDVSRPELANPRCDGWSRVPGTVMKYRPLANGRYALDIVPCGSRGVVVGWIGHLVDTHAGTDVPGTRFRITAASYTECSAVLDAALAAEVMAKSTRVWMQR